MKRNRDYKIGSLEISKIYRTVDQFTKTHMLKGYSRKVWNGTTLAI
jgi:hypothetical protein